MDTGGGGGHYSGSKMLIHVCMQIHQLLILCVCVCMCMCAFMCMYVCITTNTKAKVCVLRWEGGSRTYVFFGGGGGPP